MAASEFNLRNDNIKPEIAGHAERHAERHAEERTELKLFNTTTASQPRGRERHGDGNLREGMRRHEEINAFLSCLGGGWWPSLKTRGVKEANNLRDSSGLLC